MTLAPVVVLAGGLGTRIRSLTEHAAIPKALVPVNGLPFIDHKLAELARAGAERIVMLVGHRGGILEDHVGDGSRFGLSVLYISDGPTLLGTGGALLAALSHLPHHFWVTYGDTLLDVPMERIEVDFPSQDALGAMTVLENHDRWEPSNVEVTDGWVTDYRKVVPAGTFSFIDYGMLLLQDRAFDTVRSLSPPFDLGVVLQQCITNGRLRAYQVRERFHEIGTPEGLAETEAWLRGRR